MCASFALMTNRGRERGVFERGAITPRKRLARTLWLIATTAGGCTGTERSRPADTTLPTQARSAVGSQANLIDTTHAPAVAGAEGWNYHQTATADLDGDGKVERVVITARVEMMRGRPLWDDGQPWQLYVESPDSQRTYMYRGYVQLGTLTMRLTEPDSGETPRIVILEHLPQRLAIYEGDYRGVGKLTSTKAYERAVDPRGETSPSVP